MIHSTNSFVNTVFDTTSFLLSGLIMLFFTVTQFLLFVTFPVSIVYGFVRIIVMMKKG